MKLSGSKGGTWVDSSLSLRAAIGIVPGAGFVLVIEFDVPKYA